MRGLKGRQSSFQAVNRINPSSHLSSYQSVLWVIACLLQSSSQRLLDSCCSGSCGFTDPPSTLNFSTVLNLLGKNEDQSSSSNEVSSEAEVIVFIWSQAERC